MLFVVTGTDRPGALEDRLATRPDHLAHWQALGKGLDGAGPFLDEKGDPCGSLILIDVEDESAANRLADTDPYVDKGVFESRSVKRWNWALNKPEGL